MNWNSAADFFAMGGYGLYVWGSYGVMAAWMLVEPLLARRRHRMACEAIIDSETETNESMELA